MSSLTRPKISISYYKSAGFYKTSNHSAYPSKASSMVYTEAHSGDFNELVSKFKAFSRVKCTLKWALIGGVGGIISTFSSA